MKRLFLIVFIITLQQVLNAQAFKVGDVNCNHKSANKTFTVTCPVYYTSGSEVYSFDIDNDLGDDIKFTSLCSNVPSSYIFSYLKVEAASPGVSIVETSTVSPYVLIKNLPYGSRIDTNSKWTNGGYLYRDGMISSVWVVGGQQTNPFYIGFRKITANDTIYGWISTSSILPGVIGAYAYKSVSDTLTTTSTPAFTNTLTTMCLGDTLALTATPSSGYFFGPGVIGNIFYSSLVGPGTYKLQYKLSSSPSAVLCKGTAFYYVTVNAPNTQFTGAPYYVCTNSTLTLTGSPSGGVFNGSGISGNVFNSAITGAGSYSVSYTATDVNGCSKTVYTAINVNPPPAFIKPQDSVCAGSSLTLIANPPGGTFSGPGVIGNTLNASTLTPGVYSVTYTPAFNTGCPSNIAYATVKVKPVLGTTVTVSSNVNPSCPGQGVILSAGGAQSYAWYGSWPGVINSPTIMVTPSSSYSYYVVGSYTTGCYATNGVSIFQVVDQPTISVSALAGNICPGTPVQLFAGGCSTYSWSTGATGSVCAISPTITTNYSVVGTSTANCKDTAYITQTVKIPTVTATASSYSICAGNQVTLIGNGASYYSWNTGCNATTCLESPTVSTSYTLVGSNYGGCSDTAYVAISVDNSNLILNVVSSNDPICAGNTVTLNLSGSSGGYLVQSVDNSFQTTVSVPSVQINPTVTTTYIVYGHQLPSGCTATGFFTQNVLSNVNVNVSSPTNSLCPGQSIVLTATGAPSYSWSTGSTAATTAINPTVSTTYTLTGINTNGCTNTISFFQNVASPSVNVTGSSSTICNGGTATLVAYGALTYSWSNGTTTHSTVVNPSITTTYTVVGSNYGGCSDTDYFTQIVIQDPPVTAVASQTAICIGDTSIINLSGGIANYSIFSDLPGWIIMTVPGPTAVITPTASAGFTVTNGCSAPVSFAINVSSCVGVKEISSKENSIRVFPNPNNGEFLIRGTREETIYISNELGQLINTKHLDSQNNYSIKINDLPSGIYFVGNRISRQKIVVIK